MSSTTERVWQSYQRCTQDFSFLHDFYLNFINASPDIERQFAGTDIDHQVIMLRGSLELMLGKIKPTAERADLEKMAHLHSRKGVGIPPKLYDCWLESLILTIRNYDDAFDQELENAWRKALEPGITYMKSSY